MPATLTASSASSAPPRSRPARVAVAVVLTALGFAAIVGSTYAAGYGRDLHAVRVAAAVLFMLPVALVLVWRNYGPRTRLGGAAAALLLGAAAWWQIPCRFGGMNLLVAASERDHLRLDMELVRFEDVRRAGMFRQRIDDLARDYPGLAASVRPDLERWGADAAAAVIERFHEIPPHDITAARTAQARGLELVQSFPERRPAIVAEFRKWAAQSLRAQIDELSALRLTDWNQFNQTANARRQLVQSFQDTQLRQEASKQLIAAEQLWVQKSAGEACEAALRARDTKPAEVEKVCLDTDRRIRALRALRPAAEEFRGARLALFRVAHDAIGREIRRRIQAEEYEAAFTIALSHEQEWLKPAGLLGDGDKKQLAELREVARHLAIRFEKAGFVGVAPEPRARETAPAPRPRP